MLQLGCRERLGQKKNLRIARCPTSPQKLKISDPKWRALAARFASLSNTSSFAVGFATISASLCPDKRCCPSYRFYIASTPWPEIELS
jgi:hypothetical protein